MKITLHLWTTTLKPDIPLDFVVDDGRLTEAKVPELGPEIVRVTTPWSDFEGAEHNPPVPATALLRQEFSPDESSELVSVAAIGAGGPPVSPERPTGLSVGTDGSVASWTWHPHRGQFVGLNESGDQNTSGNRLRKRRLPKAMSQRFGRRRIAPDTMFEASSRLNATSPAANESAR